MEMGVHSSLHPCLTDAQDKSGLEKLVPLAARLLSDDSYLATYCTYTERVRRCFFPQPSAHMLCSRAASRTGGKACGLLRVKQSFDEPPCHSIAKLRLALIARASTLAKEGLFFLNPHACPCLGSSRVLPYSHMQSDVSCADSSTRDKERLVAVAHARQRCVLCLNQPLLFRNSTSQPVLRRGHTGTYVAGAAPVQC